jgi:hypothetical protein
MVRSGNLDVKEKVTKLSVGDNQLRNRAVSGDSQGVGIVWEIIL